MYRNRPAISKTDQKELGEEQVQDSKTAENSDLIVLLRLLTKQPPREHDFRTCAICKRYGLTKI